MSFAAQLGISESYLNERVQTIFLNGRAVDDLFGEVVGNNSTIALSAAMPGLAGAVFRKGGMLSSLRNPRAGTDPGCVSGKPVGTGYIKNV